MYLEDEHTRRVIARLVVQRFSSSLRNDGDD